MKRLALFGSVLLLAAIAFGQSQSSKRPSSSPTDDNPDDILNAPMTPPRSDKPLPSSDKDDPGSYSSSKNSQGDLTPPAGDDTHPGGDVDIEESTGVMEMKPWDPHAADKDVEVGIFYFKRSNYRAAEARFRDALHWQDNHAEATYRLAAVLEKEGKAAEAQKYYKSYLKIHSDGEFVAESKKALARLSAADEGSKKAPQKKTATSPPS